MTDANRILIVRARSPQDILAGKPPLALGVTSKQRDGWRFIPFTSARKSSRKGHATWDKSLPRWTGGLSGTESRPMKNGETVADVLRGFDA